MSTTEIHDSAPGHTPEPRCSTQAQLRDGAKLGALLAMLLATPALVSQGVSPKETFTLVQQGRPVATIVTAAGATENSRTAAAELQRYVRKMSGAELPVVDDTQSPAGPLILVGTNRFTAEMRGLEVPTG